LGDDGRVNTEQRTSHAGSDAEMVGLSRDGSEGGPYKGRLTLLVDPWMKMVGNQGKLEPGLFGRDGLLNQASGAVLLAG
jgi:hypothetical protein